MARARNIKPSFFDNDTLAENDPLGRLLFIGLWTLADFKGDIEWRPKRIKAKILPFDNCDINKLAINLDKSGFIRYYSVQDILYCRVVNFDRHQNPHLNERKKGSDIPEFDESSRQVIDFNTLTINPDLSRQNREYSGTNPADSFNLIPDSLNTPPTRAKPVDNFLENEIKIKIPPDFRPDEETIEYAKSRSHLGSPLDQNAIDEFINTNDSS